MPPQVLSLSECASFACPVQFDQTETKQLDAHQESQAAIRSGARNCHVAIETSTLSVARLTLDSIVPDPHQPRRDFNPQNLDRLAASIKKRGLKTPVRICREDSLQKYMILTGERRFRAAKQAGLDALDCIIVEGELTEADRLEEQLTENLLREDLNPIEKGLGIRALMSARNWNQKQLAEDLQISTSDVTRFLAVLDLPEKIQTMVEDGTLAPRTAYEITKLHEAADQLEVAGRVVNQRLDTKTTAKLVRLKKAQTASRKGRCPAPEEKHSQNETLLEKEAQTESERDSFSFLLNQYTHPSGRISSILKADRDDVTFIEQINTLQAHVLILKRAYKEKRGS